MYRYNDKRDDRTKWELLKEFINKRVKTGSKFTRKNLLSYIYPNSMGQIQKCATDTYRLMLVKEHIGIIKTDRKPGVYIKVRDIPEELTLKILYKIAYDNQEWRKWFCPFDQRLKDECGGVRNRSWVNP